LEAGQLVIEGAKLLGKPKDNFVPCHKGSWSGGLGQLSFKEEAAGKLRIFAIVDS